MITKATSMIRTNNTIQITSPLVRIHAHLCGDGGVYQYQSSEKDRIRRAYVMYFNNNADLIRSFRRDMQHLFHVQMTFIQKRDTLKVASIRIATFLLRLSEYGTRTWRIPPIIKGSSRKHKLEWIKAFSLDEGYLPPDRNCIRIKSMNVHGLQDLKEMLDSLHISSSLSGPNCDESYYLNIKKMAELTNFSKKKSRKYSGGRTFIPHGNLNLRPTGYEPVGHS